MKVLRIIMIAAGIAGLALQVSASSTGVIESATPTSSYERPSTVSCDIQQAFRHGANGDVFPDSCLPGSGSDFLFAFQSGQHVHELRNELNEIKMQLAVREDILLSVKGAAYELETRLVSRTPPGNQRLSTLLKLRELEQQKSNIEADIAHFEFERSYRQKLCDSMEESYSKT